MLKTAKVELKTKTVEYGQNNKTRTVGLRSPFQRIFGFALVAGLFFFSVSSETWAKTSRIKDIVDVEGVRENQLVGYGLVVGLNGTGDGLSNSPFTEQSLIAMLERLGVNVRGENMNTGNVAAVMVTATLPPFTNQGSRIDVNVSALGDAKSLQGGTLLVTPLIAADGEVYAVGQGEVNISGFSAEGDAQSVTQNVPTAGRIPSGAIVEREINFNLEELQEVRLALRNPDFTTSRRIAQAINGFTGTPLASAENSASVLLKRPPDYQGSIVDLITDVELLPVQPDQPAKVVISERSGVVVMGADVRVSSVAIAQGNLTLKITETPQVSQANPFADQGQTVVVPRSDVSANVGEDVKLAVLDSGVTLQELVTSLNKLGVKPRDIITILQAIKTAGALQAEIEVM
ncbi:MAG: flagellar basal body P-ring protein FlgI [Rhodospirillales bacterium]|nr:flagellar basal body P-ring protein FlgI [Alphaproteobacteria bacterium]MCB9976208.1 flagellar basal body P-ring protein FlgI [Rhodospirillales bacterium]